MLDAINEYVQGHVEHTHMNVDFSGMPRVRAFILCRVVDLKFRAHFFETAVCLIKHQKLEQAPWNAILSGCSEIVLGRVAIMFKEMRLESVAPNEATLKCLLPAYAITTDLR